MQEYTFNLIKKEMAVPVIKQEFVKIFHVITVSTYRELSE